MRHLGGARGGPTFDSLHAQRAVARLQASQRPQSASRLATNEHEFGALAEQPGRARGGFESPYRPTLHGTRSVVKPAEMPLAQWPNAYMCTELLAIVPQGV